MRLQKFLARAGVASRRKCEELIMQGRVRVNGDTVREMGTVVDPACDVVEYDGVVQSLPEAGVTLMLNKPRGYVTAMEDARSRTVAELVPVKEHPGLFPVGRLDRDTTGLLLFTTDGELGNALLHPSRHVEKRYVATIDGVLGAREVRALERGVQLEDGMTSPARCEVLSVAPDRRTSEVALTIHEGKKRQVRRMFAAVGHEVRRLRRESLGPLCVSGLSEGQWRLLDDAEVALLRACTQR